MNREITTHRVNELGNPLNAGLTVTAIGEPGPGGASMRYKIEGGDDAKMSIADFVSCDIRFQNGNPANAINGVSNEALLAIVMDRLNGFQQGPFACDDNAWAYECIVRAMRILHKRNIDRTARGVAGEQVP